MPLFTPLEYTLKVLEARWPEEKKTAYKATYEADVYRGTKIVIKAIGFELGGVDTTKEAKSIIKCLWTELKHIESANTSETILTILKEFSKRFLESEEGRTEVLKIMSGTYEVEEDSENSDCDSLCSSCESSEKRERDGWHRMRMLIREMAGPDARRSGIALRKKLLLVEKKRSAIHTLFFSFFSIHPPLPRAAWIPPLTRPHRPPIRPFWPYTSPYPRHRMWTQQLLLPRLLRRLLPP